MGKVRSTLIPTWLSTPVSRSVRLSASPTKPARAASMPAGAFHTPRSPSVRANRPARVPLARICLRIQQVARMALVGVGDRVPGPGLAGVFVRFARPGYTRAVERRWVADPHQGRFRLQHPIDAACYVFDRDVGVLLQWS